MLVSDFNYHLPPELIAQEPVDQRDQSRLLVLRRADGSLAHHVFGDLPAFLRAGDLLVLNDTRVLRARLRGHKTHGGGRVEILLGEELGPNDWWVMLRPGKRVRIGTTLSFPRPGGVPIQAVVREKDAEGLCRLVFEGIDNLRGVLDEIGEVPLPPYIERPDHPDWSIDAERYQTVYARAAGAVAAPTAGLHFTPALLSGLEQQGVELCRVTLHVGLGTFRAGEDLDPRRPRHARRTLRAVGDRRGPDQPGAKQPVVASWRWEPPVCDCSNMPPWKVISARAQVRPGSSSRPPSTFGS